MRRRSKKYVIEGSKWALFNPHGLNRAISKLSFELGIGPICSW